MHCCFQRFHYSNKCVVMSQFYQKMSVKIIAVFLSYLFASWAFHNSSCTAPSHQKILLGSNVHIQATKMDCDDHIEISISETIESGSYQPEFLLSQEKERKAKGLVETNNKIDVTPSGKNLRSLSTRKLYDQKYFKK